MDELEKTGLELNIMHEETFNFVKYILGPVIYMQWIFHTTLLQELKLTVAYLVCLRLKMSWTT